jgi:anaerobic ribonucleoside-triphosphate reductase
MNSRDAFIELRTKIRNELSAHPETSGGQILSMENDPGTGDLLVTAQYADGQRTHRIVIKNEPVDVPRET